jgi:hypothetical protein
MVYFKAGYADGMGIPLIPTCEKKFFDESKAIADSKDPRKIKFDIEHHNMITYESAAELKTKLINRIKATII